MTQAHPTSGAEPEIDCPVSLEVLGSVYRADEYDLPIILEQIPAEAGAARHLPLRQEPYAPARAEGRPLLRSRGSDSRGWGDRFGDPRPAHLKPSKPTPDPAAALTKHKPLPGQKKVSLAGAAKPAISLGGSAKIRNFE